MLVGSRKIGSDMHHHLKKKKKNRALTTLFICLFIVYLFIYLVTCMEGIKDSFQINKNIHLFGDLIRKELGIHLLYQLSDKWC